MPKEPTVLPNVNTMIEGLPANDARQQLSIRSTQGGLFVVAVQGAKASDSFTVTAFAADGRLIGQRSFNAATVVSLPRVSGELIFCVEGQSFRQTKKLSVR